MVKVDKYYLFLAQFPNSLCILNGGQLKKLKHENLSYYYENLLKFSRFVIKATVPIQKTLTDVSKYVKSFGGDGTIHGTIVDIDFYNHISFDSQNLNFTFSI